MIGRKRIVVERLLLSAGATFVFAAPAAGGVEFYLDPVEFEFALAEAGKESKGLWDFKPDNVGSGFLGLLNDPLNHITAPDWYWDDMPLDNVQFQSNQLGQNAPFVAPRGVDGLTYLTNGHPQFPINNNALLANFFPDSFDILSGVPEPDNHTAMAVELISLAGPVPPVFHVTVFDKENEIKGKIELPGFVGQKIFLGILMTDDHTISRVNIFDAGGGAEGISFIEVWVPSPGGVALLAIGGLMARRRRRRQ